MVSAEIYIDHAQNELQAFNAFADENENPELPGSDWDLSFDEQGGRTTVTISIYNESLERMENLIAMGFKEGITMTLGQLQDLLRGLSSSR
jgi:uncharacterized protein YndB with AHSA1/START domain